MLGIDVSPAMIKLARNLARKGSFRVGSIWQAALPRCRLVTALGEVLCLN